jgi:hypothetical protein
MDGRAEDQDGEVLWNSDAADGKSEYYALRAA